jgi:hypothetical protein
VGKYEWLAIHSRRSNNIDFYIVTVVVRTFIHKFFGSKFNPRCTSQMR